MRTSSDTTYDAIIIGSGFGGAVAACRLTQAKKRVCLLERGRRFFTNVRTDPSKEPASDFPKLPESDRMLPDLSRLLWSRDRGLWEARDLDSILCFVAAGYGGGSLIYANVHLRPPEEAFGDWPAPASGVRWHDELDPYYVLAAYMLNVRPITDAPFHPLVKSDQFMAAADALGRSASAFHPPLAVTFERGKNAFGVEQGGCTACGECLTGCRFGAKNTLDMNYLALAEQQKDEAGESLLQVRTGAQALWITEHREGGETRYEVEYRDYLEGRGLRSVQAPRVFVCAGALGSTELLLRSRDGSDAPLSGPLSSRSFGAPSSRARPHRSPSAGEPLARLSRTLGEGFSPNADAFGMIFNARQKTDDRSLYPTVGPAITSALVFRHRDLARAKNAGGGAWFLLEEGGFPLALARHVGIIRAPLLAGRNRLSSVDNRIARAAEALTSTMNRTRALYADIEKRLRYESLEPSYDRPLASLADAMVDVLKEPVLKNSVPPALIDAFASLQRNLQTALRGNLRATVQDVQNRLADEKADRISSFLHRNRDGAFAKLLRRGARLAMARLLPHEHVTSVSEQALLEQYGSMDRVSQGANLLKRLLAFEDPNGLNSVGSMVLLAMGIDAFKGTLLLRGGELRADVDIPIGAPVYEAEDRLMQDVATSLGGELRINPFWALTRKPVTVHSQGGCAMSAGSDRGVTDEYGRVYGYDGLYVLDASVFPSSIGANPSATILALAERNIARILRTDIGHVSFEAAERSAADAWWSKAKGRLIDGASRTAIAPPVTLSEKPVSRPIGIRFSERLYGYHAEASVPLKDSDYDSAELAGRRAGQYFALELTAETDNIAEFLADPHSVLSVHGSLTLQCPDEPPRTMPVTGTLNVILGTRDTRARRMYYELTSSADPFVHLRGHKTIFDDYGPDVIRDTTTLCVQLTANDVTTYGVMHVALHDLFNEQLRSFTVTGTDDPVRIAWALGSFFMFFFGELQKVYLPNLGRIVDLTTIYRKHQFVPQRLA